MDGERRLTSAMTASRSPRGQGGGEAPRRRQARGPGLSSSSGRVVGRPRPPGGRPRSDRGRWRTPWRPQRLALGATVGPERLRSRCPWPATGVSIDELGPARQEVLEAPADRLHGVAAAVGHHRVLVARTARRSKRRWGPCRRRAARRSACPARSSLTLSNIWSKTLRPSSRLPSWTVSLAMTAGLAMAGEHSGPPVRPSPGRLADRRGRARRGQGGGGTGRGRCDAQEAPQRGGCAGPGAPPSWPGSGRRRSASGGHACRPATAKLPSSGTRSTRPAPRSSTAPMRTRPTGTTGTSRAQRGRLSAGARAGVAPPVGRSRRWRRLGVGPGRGQAIPRSAPVAVRPCDRPPRPGARRRQLARRSPPPPGVAEHRPGVVQRPHAPRPRAGWRRRRWTWTSGWDRRARLRKARRTSACEAVWRHARAPRSASRPKRRQHARTCAHLLAITSAADRCPGRAACRRAAGRAHCGHGRTAPVVVVVEDDPAIADLVELYLRRDGFRVHQAADAEPGPAGHPRAPARAGRSSTSACRGPATASTCAGGPGRLRHCRSSC